MAGIKNHSLELAALWSLAVIVIIGSIFVAGLGDFGLLVIGGDKVPDNSQTHGIVIGGLMAALPLLINSIRGIGQNHAMQTMADQLGKSAPVVVPPFDLTGVEAGAQIVADAAQDKADEVKT